MVYYRYSPPPPLSRFVACLWYSCGFEGSHQRERLLPNGESGIVFDLREQPLRMHDPLADTVLESQAPAVFCGARTDCFVIETSQQERVIGIQFKPGGAFPFLGLPACEVAHATHDLSDVWPCHGELLREQLLASKSVQAMFMLLEQTLLFRFHHWAARSSGSLHPAVVFAVDKLQRPARTWQVAALAEQTGLSSRRFIQLFEHQTGLTPKAFQRVRRFQRVLEKLRSDAKEERWANFALDFGYYDQAHFIHDFKHFSGLTPGEYMKIATPHLNHLPIA